MLTLSVSNNFHAPRHAPAEVLVPRLGSTRQCCLCSTLPMSDELPEKNPRISIPQYAMALAHVASLRSEDPFRKVGAAALDFDNRVVGTAYNGLAPGFNAPDGFWNDRAGRQKFMLHAEINLCSLFK